MKRSPVALLVLTALLLGLPAPVSPGNPTGAAAAEPAVLPAGGDPGDAAGSPPGDAAATEAPAGPPPGEEAPPEWEEPPAPDVADPLEPLNRALFVVNDKAYFWVMKPVARGYRAVVPQGVRLSVRSFFSNLATPIRFANNLLQGKVRGAGVELLRFAINSTIGMAGFFDPARNDFRLTRRDEDLGQTFGKFGLGHGIYVVLPLLGPSSLRDAVGLAGDAFLDPVNYLGDATAVYGVKALKAENELSLTIGEYEDLKKSAIDPYAAVRDAYVQYREKKVRE